LDEEMRHAVPPDRRRLALVATPLLAALALSLVIAAGDRPLARRRETGRARTRAAIALRDHVIPFQKWGTKLFTLPLLEEAYDDVVYLTQDRPGDKRAELVAALERALAAHDDVDLFLLAHGNRFVDWVAAIDPALRARLRLVYNTGCGGAGQAADWRAAGADVYVGHAAPQSLSPAFYFYFLRRWARGWTLDEAVAAANRAAARRLSWFGMAGGPFDASAEIFGPRDLWVGASADGGAR
jgi:hypothetical protein